MGSIKKNFIFNSLSSVLSIIVPIITTPYITRVLGPEILGEYSYNYTIATYFVTVAMLGINNYGNRTIASNREDSDKLSQSFWSIYFMQLFIGMAITVSYIMYAAFLNELVAWVLLAYVFSAVFNINWFFYGMELFRLTVPRNILIKLITTVCIFIFVKNGSDMWKYAFIIGAGSIISEVALWPYVYKYIQFYKPTYREALSHVKPNVVLFIPVLAISIYKLMDKVMLGVLADKIEVGYYEASEKLILIPNSLITSLGTVMLPRMSNLFAKDEESKVLQYIKKAMFVSMLITIPISLGIMAVSRELVPVFFGAGYGKCIYLIQALLPSCIFVAFANVVRTLYLIPNRMDKVYIRSVWLGACVNLIINILLIPSFKSIGAAIGTVCAEASVCIYQSFVTRHKIKIWESIKMTIRILAIGILMYIVVFPIGILFNSIIITLLIKVMVGICVFCALAAIMYFKHKFITEKGIEQ